MAKELKIELIVDDKGTAHIKSFADGATDHLKKVEGAGRSMDDSFAKSWQGMAVGLNQGIQLFQQLAGAVQAPIEAYMQAEKAQVKMGMAMKNQGDFSKAALADMEEYAAQIQRTTAFEDDATLAVMANMKSYGMSNEQVKAATKAALDLATAKAGEGMTVERASEIMGKSYLGISTGLKKLGIQVDETKSKSELFNDVMGQVQDRFGGSAQAELLTYSGQWKQLKNQWQDIQEVLGLGLLKSIQAVGFAMSMMGAGFWKTAEMILSGWGLIVEGMADVSKLIGLQTIGSGLASISEGLKAGAQNAKEASGAAIANADANYKNMMSFDKVSSAIDAMGKAGKRTTGLFKEDEKTLKDILASLTAANKTHYEERVAASDHWLKMSKLGSYDDLATTAEVIDKKKVYLNEWYDEQVKIIEQSVIKESEQTAKLTALWREYNKTWIGFAYEREYTAAQITKKAVDDAVEGMKEEIASGVKLTGEGLQRAKERGEAARDLYRDMRGYEKEYYNESIALINEQAVRYRQLGLDEVAIAKWVADETEKADIRKAISGKNFIEGINAGFKEMQRNAMTFGKAGYEIFRTFADSSQTAISSVLFDGIKKGTVDVQAVWQSFADTMLKKFTDIIAQMVVEAATKQIILMFKSSWVDTGAAVINFISGVLGLGNIGSGGGGDGGSPPIDTSLTSPVNYYAGGLVPGYAFGGDSHSNDTVQAMLSPGEYVVPRSVMNALASQGRRGDTMLAHINPVEAALLKSIGGSGTINPKTGLPEFGFWDALANVVTGGAYGAVTGDYGGQKGIWTFLNPGAISLRDAVVGAGYGKWSDVFDALFDPVTGPGIDNITSATGKTVNEIIPWIGGIIDIIGPMIGAIIAGAYSGSAAGSAGGAALGSRFASKWNSYSNDEALKRAAIAAAVTYVTTSAGQYASGAAAWAGAGSTTSAIAGKAVSYATKWLMGQLVGAAFPPEQGQIKLSYQGAQDGGLLASLSALMGDIAPKESPFSFPVVSARSGLEYVPYDNFPIIAHRGERVQTESEANRTRSGQGGGDIHVHVHYYGTVIEEKRAAVQIADLVYPRLKKLEAWGH